MRLLVYSHKNNRARIISKRFDIILILFSQYSHKIRDQRKTAETSVTFDVKSLKMNEKKQSFAIFELDNLEKRGVTAET